MPHSLVCSATYEVEGKDLHPEGEPGRQPRRRARKAPRRRARKATPKAIPQGSPVGDPARQSRRPPENSPRETLEAEALLLHPDHGHRLLLDVVERVALELDLLEINVHQVDAADVAVPCRAVV